FFGLFLSPFWKLAIHASCCQGGSQDLCRLRKTRPYSADSENLTAAGVPLHKKSSTRTRPHKRRHSNRREDRTFSQGAIQRVCNSKAKSAANYSGVSILPKQTHKLVLRRTWKRARSGSKTIFSHSAFPAFPSPAKPLGSERRSGNPQ